ncbi:MAG: hypothetical protein GXP29_01380 [Planctomycetes bacterium]|nr:hypothetical protein [Planctomycetota bacterium]
MGYTDRTHAEWGWFGQSCRCHWGVPDGVDGVANPRAGGHSARVGPVIEGTG